MYVILYFNVCVVLFFHRYDITEYIDEHPGWARFVFQECGTDATATYTDIRRHDEDLLLAENMSRFLLGDVCTIAPDETTPPASTTTPATAPTTVEPVETKPFETTSTAVIDVPTPTVSEVPSSCLGFDEVENHATADDCWYILYDKVYVTRCRFCYYLLNV